MSEPSTALTTIDQIEGTPTPQQGADILREALDGAQVLPAETAAETAAEVADPEQPPEPVKEEPAAASEPAAPVPYVPPQRPDAAERYAAIADELKALGAQYDSGEIATDEYHAQTLALHDERTGLVVANALAVEHARAAEHQTAAAWSAAQAQFWTTPGNDKFASDPILFGAMNAAIQTVGVDPAIRAQGFAAVLDAAKARVEQAFGAPGAPPARTPVDVKAAARAQAAAARHPVPSSLTDFPGGAPPPADEFAGVADKAPADLLATVLSYSPEKLAQFVERRV
jgi:GNAT superfamily N-acetyltransferase